METKLKVKLMAHTPEPDKVVASAAKLCYSPVGVDQIQEKLDDEKIANFVNHLVSIGHESPLEHVSFTFAIEGISRACYDDKTEVLTSEGWKLFKDVKENEIVATFNKETEKVEFHKINEKIEYNYNGEMHKYHNQCLDLLVTPNHNMLVTKYDVRKKDKWKLIKSENLNLKRYRMIKNFDYDKDIDNTITIQGYNYQRKNNKGVYYTKYTGDLVLDRKLFYKFLAWYLSDGSVRYDKNENSYTIQICQTKCEENIKNDTINRIMSIITNLGFKCNYSGKSIRFNSLTLGRYLYELGKSYNKKIPFNIFENFNKCLAKIFVDEYFKGDGHIDKNGCGKIYTTSKELANQIQILSFIAGYTSKLNVDDRVGEVNYNEKCGNAIRHNYKCYVLNITLSNKRNLNPILKTEKHIQKEQYDGKVYCVNVDNHTLFVRRNGIAIWCGNCSHQIVRHRIANFSQQSQRYVKLEQFEYVIPPQIAKNKFAKEIFEKQMKKSQEAYDLLVDELIDDIFFEKYRDKLEEISMELEDGKETRKYHIDTQEIDLLKRKYPKIYSKIEKQAIEDARYVFPNACETKMVFTINARSLLNFFSKRCCERAQWEIRAVADEMLKLVKEVAPIIFKNAGAPCVRGACPEGSMSCGHPKSSKGDA